MNTIKFRSIIVFVLLSALIANFKAFAQASVPPEVSSIIGKSLEDGQGELSKLGYEICASSFFGKKQDWFNESSKVCVTVKFDKKTEKITEVLINPDVASCQRGLEASRKLWENYHDGQAPVQSAKLDEERKKLADQGYTVSYWVNDVSPGRSAEYWVNETTKKAMFIVWETQGTVWVMTSSTEYESGHNPAPKNN
jgi:hypothetical protein